MPGQGIGVSERVAKATISMWLKKLHTETIQNYALLSVIQKKGNVNYGGSGGELRWVFQYRDHDLDGHIDGAPKAFKRKKVIENANLDWRGYESTEVITLKEREQQSGEEAMIKIFGAREKMMREGLMRQLGKEWYVDGNAAGNAERFHGVESMMSSGVQTAADDLATLPNDTYAGVSTAYGSLKSNAVKGVDEEYGVWSPVIVNTNVNPGGGNRAWADFADEFMRLGIIEASYGTTSTDNIDLILLTKTAYRQFLNIADDKERINIMRGADVELVSLGFKNFVNFDGVQVGWDFGISATDPAANVVHGYGFNCDKLYLKVLGGKDRKTLWGSKLTWNDDYASDRIYLHLLGNLCFESPRHFVAFKDLN